MTEESGVRKCDECTEHSGIVAKLDYGEKLMAKFDRYMEAQTKRTIGLAVGIILCLVTGIISIYTSSNSQKNYYNQNSQSTWGENEVTQYEPTITVNGESIPFIEYIK